MERSKFTRFETPWQIRFSCANLVNIFFKFYNFQNLKFGKFVSDFTIWQANFPRILWFLLNKIHKIYNITTIWTYPVPKLSQVLWSEWKSWIFPGDWPLKFPILEIHWKTKTTAVCCHPARNWALFVVQSQYEILSRSQKVGKFLKTDRSQLFRRDGVAKLSALGCLRQKWVGLNCLKTFYSSGVKWFPLLESWLDLGNVQLWKFR